MWGCLIAFYQVSRPKRGEFEKKKSLDAVPGVGATAVSNSVV